MADEAHRERVERAIRQINHAWLHGRVDDLTPMIHPEIVFAFPGFTARARGREDFLHGFREFCQNATIHEFREHDRQLDLAGDTAVVTFRYAMLYERSGKRYRATGRDLWVFQLYDGQWLAAWRTMLDLEEHAA